ncbi:MAG: hypothetical protein OXH16_02655 [Gemmatimonadetes bacterium]|nr:hypothetical protein [Gemmatimonadota bacterium]
MQLEITAKFDAEVFLRSINIQYDAEYPNRIAHYQPTAKSVPLIKSLLGFGQDRAFFVVAPYGTGKSITATYLLHLVENRPDADETLSAIEDKLKAVSPDLNKFAMERRNETDKGLVLALQGYCENLGKSLKDAALKGMGRIKLGRQARTIASMPCETIEQAIELLGAVRDKARAAGCDQVVILWDEFGRHIESLIAEGRSAALSEIQLLAESVSRSIAIPVTLGLLLHQELLQYASHSPASVRTEWRKIEGRFQTIQYIDDSKEIYRLLSEVVSEQNSSGVLPDKQVFVSAKECKQLGLFSDFTVSELQSLLRRAYPLEPTTLYLLPRISGRVAQNERTLFSFLNFMDFQNYVRPDHLYEYFSPEMRTDTAVGGTYKQWLETQNALSKLDNDNDLAATALRTASLLGFGVNGERSRTSRDLLLFALRGYAGAGIVSNGSQQEEAVVAELIDKKLLLHRKHSDEVSVWHGTDADLRGRLEEEKSRQRRTFDFLTFLMDEAYPPVWRPVMYNSDFHIRRFLQGEYCSLEKLDEYLNMPVRCDGKIIYVVAETVEELQEAKQLTSKYQCDDRAILAVPRVPVPLFEAALEVWCLTQMQEDDKLVESDPMVLSEIQQMTDDARSHLQKLLDRLILPSREGPRWFYKGGELSVKNAYDLRNELSEIMQKIFHYTPKINNEMIVRHKPTPTVVNSRKKLLLGILDRSGQENLGIKGNSPDASMFRTILFHTGLYTNKDEVWNYALPEQVEDLGLQKIWKKIQQFFTVSSDQPKDIRRFFDELMEPPFGVRAGLLPILFAAGLKAFPSVYSLRYKGSYVSDILPSDIEQLCREPEEYEFIVLDIDRTKRDYLSAVLELFDTQARLATGNDLIRACYDALENWKAGLPAGALSTRFLTQQTRRFQDILRHQSDPVQLLFERIPRALGCSIDERHVLLESLEKCKNELFEVVDSYREKAISSLRRALSLNWKSNGQVKEIANRWALCFPDEISDALNDNKSKSLLSRMRMTYKSDAKLIDSLSGLFFQKTISRWDDSYIANFDREIRSTVRHIEESALSFEFKTSGAVKNGLANLVQERMNVLYERLTDIVGQEEARALFVDIIEDNIGED